MTTKFLPDGDTEYLKLSSKDAFLAGPSGAFQERKSVCKKNKKANFSENTSKKRRPKREGKTSYDRVYV